MPQGQKKISHLYKDTDETGVPAEETGIRKAENGGISYPQPGEAKSHLRSLIKKISREVRHHEISYPQLKYVFRRVRERCKLEAPTPPKRLKELPTEEEIERFFAVIKSPVHSLMFSVLLGTGLRVSEFCNLEVKRIDLGQNTLFVSEGKGKKDRIVVFGNKLKERLALYLDGKQNRYLFQSNRGSKYSTRRIEQICEQYRKAANIEKEFTPHTARHLWNTAMAMAGVSEERRAILAGHEQGSGIQKTYTHLSAGGFKDEIVAVLDRLKR